MRMSLVTLDRLVKGGHVAAAQAARTEWLWSEIRRLKHEKRAFIPAHNYQVPEVQEIADTVGDSFELAVRARDVDAAIVVFCGVRFMAEGCATLAPERASSVASACPMPDPAPVTTATFPAKPSIAALLVSVDSRRG